MADLSSLSFPLSRKQYTRAQKADIVEQSMAPGVSIASVAVAHGINANQLHKWRYLYKKGEFGPMHRQSHGDALELLPVRVALDVPQHKKSKPVQAAAPAVWFAYSRDRQGIHLQKHLKGYRGVLQADAFAGYDEVFKSGEILEAACWAC